MVEGEVRNLFGDSIMCPTVQNYFYPGKNIHAGVFFFSPF
jgi:hypothetical protein